MQFFRYRALIVIFVIVALYVVVVRITPIRPRGEGLRAIFLILSGWGMFAYWRPFRKAMLTEGWPSGPYLYAVMIFLFCAGININCATALLWRLSGQPAHLVNNPIYDFWVVLGIIAVAIAVTVPDLFGPDVPPRDKLQLGTVWLIMFVMVSYLVLVRPDLGDFADALRPLTDRGYEYEDPK
ncbi:hypothetical protein [Methylobacterium sp. WSM2598]|uniref:hypothetical protein n=1 Tax=Methylobacterium sp. WSM2598 TaxID=398261 RepID=UPI000365255E|nr:hypothetical protein [Methylobacterium sp. WSM2598]